MSEAVSLSTTEAAAPSTPPAQSSKRPSLSMSIAPAAAVFARQKLTQRGTPDAAVRLGIKGGGCSGFSYVIQFDDEPARERDTVYEVDGVKFYVCTWPARCSTTRRP
jgi:iron-sulfur cluster assembly protein